MARVVLALACAAQFMVVLDVSVVNVALPAVQDDLGFTDAGLPWVAGAYTLAFAGFLLLGGRLADLLGARWTFLAGLLLFCLPSLAGGLAATPGVLVAARAAQGIGAAVLAPATLTIITTTIPEGPRRTRALAVWTAVGLVGGASGNLVGGLLTEALSWRWILLVNVPVGLAAAVLARRLPDGRRTAAHARRLDVPGAAAATAGLTLLAFGVLQAESRGWTDVRTAGSLGGALVLLGVLARIETRAADPLVPPRLLRSRAIGLGNVLMLLAGGCFQVPMWYFLTLYMQDVLGFSALETGLGFLPHTLLTMLVGLRVTPRLMRRADDRVLVAAGAAVAAAGFAWQGAAAGGDASYIGDVLGPAVLVSVGGGLLNTPLTATVTGGVAGRDAGAASGLLNTAKQVGGAIGLAALAAATGTYGAAFLVMAVMLGVVAAASLALPARRDAPDVPAPHGVAARRPGG